MKTGVTLSEIRYIQYKYSDSFVFLTPDFHSKTPFLSVVCVSLWTPIIFIRPLFVSPK